MLERIKQGPLLLIILFWGLPPIANAQFYVQMEGGLKWDIVSTFASKGNFDISNKADFIGGARLGYEITPFVALEFGATVHQLNNQYIYQLDGVSWLTEERYLPAQFLQFPIRLRTTVFTVNKRFFIHPYIGISLLMHRSETGQYEWRLQQQTIEDPTNSSSFTYEYNAFFNTRYLMLGEAGISLRYEVTQYFSLLCSFGFSIGSTAIHESMLTWKRKTPALDDRGTLNAQYKGDQFSLNIGVQCSFQPTPKRNVRQ